jgi:LuxR family transcriptional regulator, maltose regulon positive regulatory protein
MIEAPSSQLVVTKLRAPAPRRRAIARARLLDRLALDPGTRLLLVSAPAGYGKTTLLAEWSHALVQSGIAVAWYTLDTSDDDPILFGSYLVASLSQALGRVSELSPVAQLLRSSPDSDLPRLLPAIINVVTSSDQPCALVLDDYHLISAPAIHSAVAFLLEHLPDSMLVVIGSRSDPPLPLGPTHLN